MINFLIPGSFLQIIGFRGASPHDIPLRAVRANNSAPWSFQRINNWVINVRWLSHFETKSHIVHSEIVLSCYFHLLEWSYIWRLVTFYNFKVRVPLSHRRTVFVGSI
jgi:hypothetical protein